jgi:hypothetical protein
VDEVTRIDLNDCILWPGRVNEHGHPLMEVATAGGYRHKGGRRFRSARQVIYAEHFGPAGGPLYTRCGRTTCVNPDHLARAVEINESCPNGHRWTAATTRWRVRRDKGEAAATRDCLVCKRVSEGKRRERLRISERTYS